MSSYCGCAYDVSEGKKTNPAASTVLADTGAITETGGYNQHGLFNVVAWMETGGDAATTLVIEHRNAANDGNIRSMEINFKAADTLNFPYHFNPASGERLRVILGATQPGVGIDVQVLITGKTVIS